MHKEVIGAKAETLQQASTNPHGGNKGKGRVSGKYSLSIRFIGPRPDIAEKNVANRPHSIRSGIFVEFARTTSLAQRQLSVGAKH